MALAESIARSESIEQFRKIAQDHRPARIGGTNVDEVTAQMVVRVYDGLSEKRKEKFGKLSVQKMIGRAFEIDSQD